MGGFGHRRRERSVVIIGPMEKVIGMIKKDIREQFGIESCVFRDLYSWCIRIQFQLTEDCPMDVYLDPENLEESFLPRFGEALINKLRHFTFKSDILFKLLPVLDHYKISFTELSSLWKHLVELPTPKEIVKKIENWQESVKKRPHDRFTLLIGESLSRRQQQYCDWQMGFFQILYEIGDRIDYFHFERKRLLLMRNEEYKYLEITFTKTQRFNYYFEHENSAFRIIFLRLWRDEVLFTIFISQIMLGLPELVPLVVMKWAQLFIQSLLED